jgi:hypothetical protein
MFHIFQKYTVKFPRRWGFQISRTAGTPDRVSRSAFFFFASSNLLVQLAALHFAAPIDEVK